MITFQTLPSADGIPYWLYAILVVVVVGFLVFDKLRKFLKEHKEGQAAKNRELQKEIDDKIEQGTSGARLQLINWKEVAESQESMIELRDRQLLDKQREIDERDARYKALELKSRELADFNFTLQGELDKAVRRLNALDEEGMHISKPPRTKRHD